MSIDVNSMAMELVKALAEYSDEVGEKVKEAVDIVATDGVKELRDTSPTLTGSYKRGWTKKKAYENSRSKRNTVYNRTDYQIAHLLEYGHTGRNGSRVAARQHIKPVEENMIDEFAEMTERIITGR